MPRDNQVASKMQPDCKQKCGKNMTLIPIPQKTTLALVTLVVWTHSSMCIMVRLRDFQDSVYMVQWLCRKVMKRHCLHLSGLMINKIFFKAINEIKKNGVHVL